MISSFLAVLLSAYTWTSVLDLVPAEPRVFYPGVANAIPAYEGYGGVDWSPGHCVNMDTGCSASSATSQVFVFSRDDLSPSHKVYWHLTWYPRTTSAGVRLVLMDSGFTNHTILASTEPDLIHPTWAYDVFRDITVEWNAALEAAKAIPHPDPGSYKYLGMQIKGNGADGPVIYRSRITFVHRIEP